MTMIIWDAYKNTLSFFNKHFFILITSCLKNLWSAVLLHSNTHMRQYCSLYYESRLLNSSQLIPVRFFRFRFAFSVDILIFVLYFSFDSFDSNLRYLYCFCCSYRHSFVEISFVRCAVWKNSRCDNSCHFFI